MIKALPRDFIVEERADLPLRPAGEFRAYVLRKTGWTTPDVIDHLARAANIPRNRISYGGKKDKHGLTTQFIAIRDPRDVGRQERSFSLRPVGFMDRPMGPDLILENAFVVTIRGLADVAPLELNMEEARRSGFPNFFDDQRFRSYDPERGFFADKILRRHWNGALQVYLTSAAADSTKMERDRKAAILESWKDWAACRRLARAALEIRIFDHLVARPGDLSGALHLIPEEEVSMRYAAFQSHLWNELLRRLLRRQTGPLEEVEGRAGSYLFWRSLDPETLSYLGAIKIPAAAANLNFPDDVTAEIYTDILREAGLRPGWFRTKELRRVSFRTFPRPALLLPQDLKSVEDGSDELHRGKKKLTVSFSLPRGAYGTMLIKRLAL